MRLFKPRNSVSAGKAFSEKAFGFVEEMLSSGVHGCGKLSYDTRNHTHTPQLRAAWSIDLPQGKPLLTDEDDPSLMMVLRSTRNSHETTRIDPRFWEFSRSLVSHEPFAISVRWPLGQADY